MKQINLLVIRTRYYEQYHKPIDIDNNFHWNDILIEKIFKPSETHNASKMLKIGSYIIHNS